MNFCEVVSDVGAVVEQARANHAIGDAPVSQHGDVVCFHATIDLDLHGAAAGRDLRFNGLGESSNFALNVWNERLSAKAGVDAHDEH